MALETLDYAIAAVSILASLFSLLFFWTVKQSSLFLKKVCLTSEGILEICLLALLALAVSTFGDDTAPLRKRIKFAVGFLYATGIFSTMTYGILIAVRLSGRVRKERLKMWKGRAGQFAWCVLWIFELGCKDAPLTCAAYIPFFFILCVRRRFMFLASSLAAFVAYLTVRGETDNEKDNGSGVGKWQRCAFPTITPKIRHCSNQRTLPKTRHLGPHRSFHRRPRRLSLPHHLQHLHLLQHFRPRQHPAEYIIGRRVSFVAQGQMVLMDRHLGVPRSPPPHPSHNSQHRSPRPADCQHFDSRRTTR